MKFILGSQSPRRKEILDYFSLPFDQISSDFDEDAVPYGGDPAAYAKILAKGKAEALKKLYPDAIILCADTVVALDGKSYGKPKDRSEAAQALSELQGKWHSVFTGVVVASPQGLFEGVEETRVLFNAMNESQIDRYLEALHWADKAGGYAIQLAGSLGVRRIDGCYYNVMGLPIHTVSDLLLKVGIDLWDHLK
jgi:septum formation protein